MPGTVFLTSLVYLTLMVAFVVSLWEGGYDDRVLWNTLRRWGKFLLLLAILALIIQVLTLI